MAEAGWNLETAIRRAASGARPELAKAAASCARTRFSPRATRSTIASVGLTRFVIADGGLLQFDGCTAHLQTVAAGRFDRTLETVAVAACDQHAVQAAVVRGR